MLAHPWFTGNRPITAHLCLSKVKVQHLYNGTSALWGVLSVTGGGGVQSRPQPKPAHTDFYLQPYVALESWAAANRCLYFWQIQQEMLESSRQLHMQSERLISSVGSGHGKVGFTTTDQHLIDFENQLKETLRQNGENINQRLLQYEPFASLIL